MNNVIGQEAAIETLQLLASVKHDRRLPNIFVSSPPGYGKTYLCLEFGKYIGAHIDRRNGADIKDRLDLVQIIGRLCKKATLNLDQRYILFIDEIAELKKRDQVPLLDAIWEPFTIITEIKTGPNKGSSFALKIPPNVSFLFATTDEGLVNHALVTRTEKIDLVDYSVDEMMRIANRYLRGRNCSQIGRKALQGVATISRSIRQLERICDKALLYDDSKLTFDVFEKVAAQMRVTHSGLTHQDILILKKLAQEIYVPMSDLCALLDVEKEQYQRIERFLIKKNMITKNTRGRRILPAGLKELGLEEQVENNFYLGEKLEA